MPKEYPQVEVFRPVFPAYNHKHYDTLELANAAKAKYDLDTRQKTMWRCPTCQTHTAIEDTTKTDYFKTETATVMGEHDREWPMKYYHLGHPVKSVGVGILVSEVCHGQTFSTEGCRFGEFFQNSDFKARKREEV